MILEKTMTREEYDRIVNNLINQVFEDWFSPRSQHLQIIDGAAYMPIFIEGEDKPVVVYRVIDDERPYIVRIAEAKWPKLDCMLDIAESERRMQAELERQNAQIGSFH